MAFERRWDRDDGGYGAKDAAIRAEFGVSPVTYYRRLLAVIGTDAAMDVDPALTMRLRQRLEARLGESWYRPPSPPRVNPNSDT